LRGSRNATLGLELMDQFKHGGNIRQLVSASGLPEEAVLDFSANINPLGPPEWLRAVVSSTLGEVVHYPDPECTGLKAAAAERFGVATADVLAGNGSTELIFLLAKAAGSKRVVIPVPSYGDYAASAELSGLDVERLLIREESGFRLDYDELDRCLSPGDLVFLGHPNNPTGVPLDCNTMLDVAARHPQTLFAIDEAFADLADGVESFLTSRPPNMVVLVSLTKTYAIPGLRLGCAVADSRLVRSVEAMQPPWSVNSIAQAVGCAALRDGEFVEQSRKFVTEQRVGLLLLLEELPDIKVYPGTANFLLLRLERLETAGTEVAERMLKDGIGIRCCNNFDGLDDRYIRVAVRTADENRRLVDSLKRAMGKRRGTSKSSRLRCIMFQGTSSNAGKSVLTAALCRILLQDGHRVAPFKSQNMSLNSFVTRSGGEMGRAQVVQAQACRLEPDVRMNPILLKPNSDTGSQVIVLGKPVGNMDVQEYVDYKPTAFGAVSQAFDSLAGEFDVIVMEGAGSPGEVNLKHHDIANMKMAHYAQAPVLLVGDIDRGGVFASFVGTMEVLAEWERKLVRGFVANRFRGDSRILDSALDYTRRHTGRPVVGVVPFILDLGLPEEDSVTFKSGVLDDSLPAGEHVEIAVIDLPHISNFTDFDALRREPDVRLRIVRTPHDLNQPDAVILPGSKNVPGDMAYLRENGLDRKILDLSERCESELVGICGGFQMLGASIADPHGLESDGKTIPGLGLLGVETVLALEKTLTRVTAVHLESGEPVTGYEIHHGETCTAVAQPCIRRDDGALAGARSLDGRLWGTYLHGVFDSDGFRRWFIDRLRVRRGLPAVGKVVSRYDLEPSFERLAQVVRRSLDMDFIYKLLRI
jgi:cobyric acid synthase CobQ/L-threonine-O-3-phosphate decarboxylase